MEIYMFLFHVETNAFFHRVTSYNRKSKILGKAGSFSQKADSQLNHKTPQLWRDVITNSYCVNDMRLSYDLGQPQNATAVA